MKRRILSMFLVLMMVIFASEVQVAEAKTTSTKSEKVKVDNKKGEEYTGRSYNLIDNTQYFLEDSEASELPYYVGMQKKSYIKKNKGKYDRVMYIGLPMYIPSYYKNGVYFEVENTDILHVEGKELVPTQQGITKLSVYDKNNKLIKSEKILVTNFNDGKDVINTRTISEEKKEDVWMWENLRSGEHWKNMVKTIQDASFFFQATHFIYESMGECQLPFVDDWQWTMYGEDLTLQRKGVCLQAAQTALYLLEDDFEEAGVIYVFGNQGHIFNWFFEDGYYYIMDFTEVIGDEIHRCDSILRDYTNSIHQFKTMKELKSWLKTDKVNLEMNYAIIMLSCMGFDYIPAWRDSGCCDTNGTLKGEHSAEIQWEKIVTENENFEVIYLNKNADVTVSGVEYDTLPTELKFIEKCLYTPVTTEYHWYYEY